MDAFEKWMNGYYIERGFISSDFEMREAFRAGMRAAASICNAADKSTHPADLADAILAEADK